MDSQQQTHFNQLFQIHLNHLTPQGNAPPPSMPMRVQCVASVRFAISVLNNLHTS